VVNDRIRIYMTGIDFLNWRCVERKIRSLQIIPVKVPDLPLQCYRSTAELRRQFLAAACITTGACLYY